MSNFLIDPVHLEETRRAYKLARTRGERKEVVLAAAGKVNMSYGGFIRHLKLGELCLCARATRKLSEREKARMAEMDSYAVLVTNQAAQYSYGEHQVRISAAFRVLRRTGRIPDHITQKQIYEARQRLQLDNKSATVARRFERSEPLEMVQMDFSRSERMEYYTDKQSGEWKLRVRNPEYTRKEQLRLWFGTAVDDATRVCYARYYVTKGEDTDVTQDLIEDTFSAKETVDIVTGEITGKRKLLQGIPRSIYVDRGPGFKTSTKLGLERAKVEMILGTNEKDSLGRETRDSNKKARGKVEKKNGDIKQMFESEFAMEMGEGFEMTLNELNDHLSRWLEWFNTTHHPVQKQEVKWTLFETAFASMSFPDENFRTLFCKPMRRRVIKRLLKVADNIWCKAPDWANDGEDLEIIASARNYYTMYKGKRLQLEVFTSLDPEVKPEKRNEDVEASLEGKILKNRLDQEIRNASHGEITFASLPDDFEDDIKYFASEPRTIRAIREQAVRFVMQCEARDAAAKPRIAFVNGEEI